MTQRVYILTWCDQPDHLHGTTLVFKTLRTGFPSAAIDVVDNASVPGARAAVEELARECGARFAQRTQRTTHHAFLEDVVYRQPTGAAIFVDPDVCFWKKVEDWSFDAFMAGRLVPRYACEYTGCLTHPRLHTSFLWIPDVEALRRAIASVKARYFEFEPFRPAMFKTDAGWERFDTGGSLFGALDHRMHAFTEHELVAYDHLFCGTHSETVARNLRPDYSLLFQRLHAHVRRDHRALKGAWRLQDDYFESRSVETPSGTRLPWHPVS